ncbi:pyridoxamine 5'-phosphate oxidase family protein [Streptomyces nitrosporeus]|uniref:Pyridoxamine 5-phosphate oxidase n=1 Tax=Streptomyces nitrosporeus TaxID=28894 RepID=A0A5J6FG49_9ACTN|nr:pyridoxamine 5'-phosphate oxidase family protein [Streptomyces nitrosporeus]QEU74767.1 pyridoxamine 5-phosphate oxidase [Streptomyces nitrosporeus]GGY85661.1 pyridoxamine 5'-phosphate oxidase [Streptomyces nitrosporeus]
MTSRYAQLLFTPPVQAHQEEQGSRRNYAAMAEGPAEADRLTPSEAAFIARAESFYLATTGSSGWPYVQHRGGPPGFLRVVDDRTLGFADYRGNKQYITTGNLDTDDRVSLLLMDYPARRRLKILGRARTGTPDRWPASAGPLVPEGYRAVPERVLLITVEAYDWNCPQHIQPRYTVAELEEALKPVRERIAELERENARLLEAARAGGRTP